MAGGFDGGVGFAVAAAAGLPLRLDSDGRSRLVYEGPNGRLAYVPDAKGNTIPDFSNARYSGGEVAIPEVSAANYVARNCEGSLVCQKPPTAQNYAIGQIGRMEAGAFNRPKGYWESFGKHVSPESLYKKQLEDRLHSCL